jgi:hypothetical protein
MQISLKYEQIWIIVNVYIIIYQILWINTGYWHVYTITWGTFIWNISRNSVTRRYLFNVADETLIQIGNPPIQLISPVSAGDKLHLYNNILTLHTKLFTNVSHVSRRISTYTNKDHAQ